MGRGQKRSLDSAFAVSTGVAVATGVALQAAVGQRGQDHVCPAGWGSKPSAEAEEGQQVGDLRALYAPRVKP